MSRKLTTPAPDGYQDAMKVGTFERSGRALIPAGPSPAAGVPPAPIVPDPATEMPTDTPAIVEGGPSQLEAKRYTIIHSSVGGHRKGVVVDRDQLFPASGTIARLIDLGAIAPAPDED